MTTFPSSIPYQLDDLSDASRRRSMVTDWGYDFPDNPLMPVVQRMCDLLEAADVDVYDGLEAVNDYDNRIDSLKCLLPELQNLIEVTDAEEVSPQETVDLLRNIANEIDKL